MKAISHKVMEVALNETSAIVKGYYINGYNVGKDPHRYSVHVSPAAAGTMSPNASQTGQQKININ